MSTHLRPNLAFFQWRPIIIAMDRCIPSLEPTQRLENWTGESEITWQCDSMVDACTKSTILDTNRSGSLNVNVQYLRMDHHHSAEIEIPASVLPVSSSAFEVRHLSSATQAEQISLEYNLVVWNRLLGSLLLKNWRWQFHWSLSQKHTQFLLSDTITIEHGWPFR